MISAIRFMADFAEPDSAQLVVNTVTPERKQGKFNAQIDSLISIGEVTLKGQVSIGIDVKSGVWGANSYSSHNFERHPSLVKCDALVMMSQ